MSLSNDLKRWVDSAIRGKLTGADNPGDLPENAELVGTLTAAQGLDILKKLVKHKQEADDGGLPVGDPARTELGQRAQQVAVAVEKKITATLLAGNPAHGHGADQALAVGKDLSHAKAAIQELLEVKANLEAAGILAAAAGPEHVRIDNRLKQLAVAAEKAIIADLLHGAPAHGDGADQALAGGKDLSHAKTAIQALLAVKEDLTAAGITATVGGVDEHARIDNRLRQLAVAAEKAIIADLLHGAPEHDAGADQALAGGKTSDNATTAIQELQAVKANLEAAGIVNGDEHDRIDNRIAQLKVALIKNTKKEELESANTAADPNGIATVEDGRKQLKALDLAIQKAQRPPHQIVVEAAVTNNRRNFVIALNAKIEAERSAISSVASVFKTDPVKAQETATDAVTALHAANGGRDASLQREKAARLLGKPSDTVEEKAALRRNGWTAVRSDETVRDAIAQQKEAVVKAKEAVEKMKEAEKDALVPETEARQNIRATEYALFVEGHRFEAKQLAANIAVYEQRLKELTAAIRVQKLIVDDVDPAITGAQKAQAQKEIADLIGKAWQCADLLKKQKELGEKLLADAKKEDDDVLNEVPDDNDIYTAAHDADWTDAQTALQTEVGKVGAAVTAWETEYKLHNAKNPISAEHQAQEGWGVEECKVRAEFEMCVLLQYSPENIAKEPLFARYKAAMAMLYPEVEVINDGADLEAKTENIRRNITRFFEKDVSVRDPMVIGPIRHDDLRAFHAGNPSYRFKKDFTVDQQVAKIAAARKAGAVTVIAIQNSARPAQFYVAEDGQANGFKTLPAYIEDQVALLNALPVGNVGIAAIVKNIKDAMDSAAKDPRYFVDTESKVKDALADIDPEHAAQRTDLLDKADKLHSSTPRITSAGDASMLLDAEFSDIRRYFLCLTHETNSDPAIKKSAKAVKKAYEDGKIKGDKADFSGNLPVDIVTMEKQNFKTNNTFKDNSDLVWTVKQPEDDKIELRCEDHELDLTVKPEKSDPTKSTIHWDSTKTGTAHDDAMLAGAALCAQTASMNGCTSGDFDLGKTYDDQTWDSVFGGCKKRDLLEARSVNAFLNSNVIVTFERHKKDKAPVWETYKSLVHGQTKGGVSTDAAAAGADAKYLDKLFDNPKNALFKQKLIHGMFEKTGTEYKGELYIWHEGKKYTEKELMHRVHTENGKPEHLGDTKVKEIIKAQADKSTLDLLTDGRKINSSDAKKSSGSTFTPRPVLPSRPLHR